MTSLYNPGEHVIERYKVIDTVGAGGMGTVYKALDITTNNIVALKLAITESDLKNRSSFLEKEYATLSQCRHHSIPKVYELGKAKGDVSFFTMELIDGASLNNLIEDNTLPNISMRIEWLKELALVLSYIHSKGFLYCDLKPHNVIVQKNATSSPFIKLIDFGLATLAQEGLKASDLEAQGTTQYMSPEQHKGTQIDVRSDIYSFGVLAYELLTRELPFIPKNNSETNVHSQVIKYSAMHMKARIPTPSAKNPDVRSDLDAIVETCLQKKRENRFDTIVEVFECLNSADGSSIFKHIFNLLKAKFTSTKL